MDAWVHGESSLTGTKEVEQQPFSSYIVIPDALFNFRLNGGNWWQLIIWYIQGNFYSVRQFLVIYVFVKQLKYARVNTPNIFTYKFPQS